MKKYITHTLLFSLFAISLQVSAAAQPKRVLIIGDSMMVVTAHALTLALDKHSEVITKSQTSIGTGLARLDAYDWMSKVDELVASFRPDLTVVWFGTNDRQPLQTDAGIVRDSDPGWEAEYSRRIGEVMDKLLSAKRSQVYWLELPVMPDKKTAEDVDLINRLAKAEADKREEVTFFPTRKLLGRKPDTYSPNIIGPDGKMIQLRASDGIHLSRPGADRVADAIENKLY